MTLPLSKEQIEAIKARAEKATPGEWGFAAQCGMRGHCDMAQVFDASGHSLADIEPTQIPSIATADAEFIAHARTDIPALCQQALRAIELEAMFQFEGDDAAHMKPNDPALKDGIVVKRDHFDEMLKRQHSLQSELTVTRKALEEERERCAKVADVECNEQAKLATFHRTEGNEDAMDRRNAAARSASNIAANIRTLPSPRVKP